MNALQRRWYSPEPPMLALRPLAALYGRIAQSRRLRLQAVARPLDVPVIVVGNLSVGGTGKTPLVIWLIERLREWGWKPGVISRGYGGHAPAYPLRVGPDTPAAQAGDEPLLIARRTRAPVAVAPDRVAAAQLLIEGGEVDILVADDGLQHYALARQLEICVIDGARGLGNGALLPAGPLREPPSRLESVDFAAINGAGFERAGALRFDLVAADPRSLRSGETRALAAWRGQSVHAVAGIGHPPRFFDTLRAAGLDVVPHAFADHHAYRAGDLDFGDDLPVLMTEKDAVKCLAFADARLWALPVDARLSQADGARVRKSVEALERRPRREEQRSDGNATG